MTRSARDAKERGWIWLLRAVGLLLAVVVLANVVEVGGALVAAVIGPSEAAPASPAENPIVVAAPGVYHVECAEFRPTMAARMSHAVQQMLPAKLIASEAELPGCQRCGDRIERGSQVWIAASE